MAQDLRHALRLLRKSPGRTDWDLASFDLQSVSRGVSLPRPKFSGALILLMSGVGLLLLMICANVAGLLLARSSARRQEAAVRLAVGATGARLVRQWLTESLLLAMLGGLSGIAVAFAATPLLARALPPVRDFDATALTLSLDLRPDWRVLLFSLALCVLTALAAGLPAALQAAREDLHTTLKAARGGTRQPLRWGLVAAQVALCTLLLAGAGLLISTFRHLRAVDPGFDQQHLVTFSLDPTMLRYDNRQAESLQSRLIAAARQLPGVRSAAIASRGLMLGTGLKASVALEGRRVETADFLNSSTNAVSPEYFDTLGMRVLAGRGFRAGESAVKPARVVVNRAFVRRFFPRADPIGRRFGIGRVGAIVKGDDEIIGVVSDAKYRSIREVIPPTVYPHWSKNFSQAFFFPRDPGRQPARVRHRADAQSTVRHRSAPAVL